MSIKRVWLEFDVQIDNEPDDHKMFLENYINRTNRLPPYDAPNANLKLVGVKVEEVAPPPRTTDC